MKKNAVHFIFLLCMLMFLGGVLFPKTAQAATEKCTAAFYDNNGKATSAFKKLKKTVTKNKYIKLPEAPETDGSYNLGWTTVKGGTKVQYSFGQKVKITKNRKFYLVCNPVYTLYLHKSNGELYWRIQVKNYTRVLPSITTDPGYTFLGWSKYKNQYMDPAYRAGDKIRLSKDLHLYAVVHENRTETDISASNLAEPDWSKYRKVIFVGDSRTLGMKQTLYRQFGSEAMENIGFVCRSAMGIGWFKNEGLKQLKSEILSAQGSSKKQIAVIFNLGINDLGNKCGINVLTSRYVNYMKSIAPYLQSKGCKLFYMSLNPFNNTTRLAMQKRGIKESDLLYFNAGLKSGLRGYYQYIDCYSWLIKNGVSYDSGMGIDTGIDDGTHYSTKTYKRIYQYCIRKINAFG